MPTYEYACKGCGQHLDVFQSFSEDPLTVCPNCGGELRKVFGNVGIVFKGSGFYKTDSRPSSAGTSGKESAKAEKKADSSGDSSSGSEKKTETKPAASSSEPKPAAAAS